MHKVYLAGPMTGLSWQTADAWRRVASLTLGEEYTCLSPMRWDHRVNAEAMDYSNDTREVMRRDFFDVQQSDVVLANFEICAETVSFGTVSEIAWAYALRKPTVMAAPKDCLYRHPWMMEMADYTCDNLAQAIKLVRKLLG